MNALITEPLEIVVVWLQNCKNKQGLITYLMRHQDVAHCSSLSAGHNDVCGGRSRNEGVILESRPALPCSTRVLPPSLTASMAFSQSLLTCHLVPTTLTWRTPQRICPGPTPGSFMVSPVRVW